MAANAFFERLGLVGGLLLIAWLDLQEKGATGKQITLTQWAEIPPGIEIMKR